MSEIKLKVCGLRDNALEVIENVKPDYIGFIFYNQSSRYVGDFDFKKLPRNTARVGVFVNADLPTIRTAVESASLDYVQLHGDESIELCSQLYAEGIDVIKVFSGNNLPESAVLRAYSPFISHYLFDTRGKTYGGSGKTFDWKNIENLQLDKPVILSGGLGLEEVERLKESKLDILGVDVNSKFELSPGLKNIDLLKELKANLS